MRVAVRDTGLGLRGAQGRREVCTVFVFAESPLGFQSASHLVRALARCVQQRASSVAPSFEEIARRAVTVLTIRKE